MKSTLISALKAAGKIQKENFRKPVSAIQKETLSSVVTETDLKSEEAIIRTITSSFPEHNILTEESGFTNKSSRYTWVIDPLDGTSNFAAGIPWFGVLIALFRESYILMSGAYLPIQDEMYLAERGKGAFVGERSLKVSSEKLGNSLFAFSTDYTADRDYLAKVLRTYETVIQNSRNVRTTNSLVDMIYVAEGRLGACINMYNRIWDIAAPGLIVQEAGGVVKDLDGKDLVFELNESGLTKNYPVMVSAHQVYEDFQKL